MIPVLSIGDQVAALPHAVGKRYIQAAVEATPSGRKEVTMRSVEHMVEFEPAGWVPYVSPTPLMMMIGAKDSGTFPESSWTCSPPRATPIGL